MFEKVNPQHPDKIADRIAGAIVDYAYQKASCPKIAVEILIGHGKCFVVVESSEKLDHARITRIVHRIGGNVSVNIREVRQDEHLAHNQQGAIRCGDNGIFKGVPTSDEERILANVARDIYKEHPTDGKYILADGHLIICQSNASREQLAEEYPSATINPLGDWTGGSNVDAGATNRKLGSDMGRAVTGGGLHGKDLSKADVSVNIYAHLKAQQEQREVQLYCAIGDEMVDGRPYAEIVEIARQYISERGGFERFAEWGLI